MVKVAVFDSKSYDQEALAAVPEVGRIEFQHIDERLGPDTVDLIEDGTQAVCVFVNDKEPREVVQALADKGVLHIALRCAGFNNLDLAAADEFGIKVSRVPAYSPYAVAEHALAMLLALNRHLPKAQRRVREMNFSLDRLVGWDMRGKTVGLIGTGKIGKVTGEIFKGLGMRVVCWDAYPDHAWAAQAGAEYVPLDELGRVSDVISLHVPLFPETHHIINALTIAEFKRGVYIINVSRGELIDTAALIDGLNSGQIGGVCLDVYEEEEGKFYQDLSNEVVVDPQLAMLLAFPNVIITSHMAYLTREALSAIATTTVHNILRCADGEPFLPTTTLGPDGPVPD